MTLAHKQVLVWLGGRLTGAVLPAVSPSRSVRLNGLYTSSTS
jgi:hypothetical protein